MQITSLSLRNYRVFETLDLELPPGLVGIYGANGSGKSTLLEAIGWALYGRARTSKQQVRTAGRDGECRAELGFELDGHHYTVIRSMSGSASTTKARVLVGGQVAADGPNESAKYLRGLLGMDEHGFRSSVFAEQKQLSAFSEQRPEERRRLVLGLLGITPLDVARDRARAEAKQLTETHRAIRSRLDDPTALEPDLAAATQARTVAAQRLEAAERHADSQRVALAGADESLRAFRDRQRAYERIVGEGKLARAEIDQAERDVERLDLERLELARLSSEVPALERAAAATDQLRTVLSTADDALDALRRLIAAGVTRVADPRVQADATIADAAIVDVEAEVVAHRDVRERAVAAKAAAESARSAAGRDLERCEAELRRSLSLAADEPCPLCGQDLGSGFTAVVEHRRAEHEVASAALLAATADAEVAARAAEEAAAALRGGQRRLDDARAEAASVRAAAAATEAAIERWDRARERLADAAARLSLGPTPDAPREPDEPGHDLDPYRRHLEAWREEVAVLVSMRTTAADALVRARTRLERVGLVDAEWETASRRSTEATARRASLRDELTALGWRPEDLATAQAAREQLATDVSTAADGARQALVEATRADAGVAALQERMDRANREQRELDTLATRAALTARTAELLHLFRTSVVNAIGPHLSHAASSLFQELTDNEYDGLTVDPDTYELQIIDGGVTYPTERFSGSEVDLANLALRVAISEQLAFQTGGRIGLLVLDEALASLDADRKDRMLAALTRLAARFRQILVVTHAPEVKEQLPRALHVVKRPGRRAEVIVDDAWGA